MEIKMKTRMFVSILILTLAVLIVIGSCATGKKAVKAPMEPFYLTWTNPDYNTAQKYAKLIFKPDGTYTLYSHTDITIYAGSYKYTIAESWMDSDGKKYYKVEVVAGSDEYHLYRLDETDSVFERVWSKIEFPSEINPNHLNYSIYYRQE
jgi:hypothetical protein